MIIKFLKECKAQQKQNRYCCDICGHVPNGTRLTTFFVGEEVDPESSSEKIDLSSLTYRVDYDIIVFP